MSGHSPATHPPITHLPPTHPPTHPHQGTNWEAEQLRLGAKIARLQEAAEGDAAALRELECEKAAAQVQELCGRLAV